MKNIFADKATLIARKMLMVPAKKWTVRDFTGPQAVSLGLAQEVLAAMEKKGYVERVSRGPNSYTIITNQQQLILDWLKGYRFELNEFRTYYNPDKGILRKIKDVLKGRYALTLHTGANFITSFVMTDHVYLYLNVKELEGGIEEIRQALDLKELVKGGNIHIIKPFYKNSAFFNTQKIRGYTVVSNLQLYLDLYHFQPRGKEHADCLKRLLEQKGKHLD